MCCKTTLQSRAAPSLCYCTVRCSPLMAFLPFPRGNQGCWVQALSSPSSPQTGDAAVLILKQRFPRLLPPTRTGISTRLPTQSLFTVHFWQKMAKVSWAHPLPVPPSPRGTGIGLRAVIPSAAFQGILSQPKRGSLSMRNHNLSDNRHRAKPEAPSSSSVK